jgi:hypothetical protein
MVSGSGSAARGSLLVVSVQLEHNAGPNLGLSHSTMGEAFVRLYPQVAGEPA